METTQGESIVKVFLSYAMPCIVSMVLTSFIIVVDGMFIGWQVGENGLAAINLTLPLLYILLAVTILIGVGGVTLAAQCLGAKETARASDYFSVSLGAILAVDTVIVLIVAVFMDDVVLLLGAQGVMQGYVKDFLSVMVYFYIFMMLNMAFSMFIRAEGKPQLSLLFGLAGNILNVILDYVFIINLDWGMRGAALASGVAVLLPFIFGMGYFLTKRSVYRFSKFTAQFADFKKILFNGAAEFIVQISISLTTFMFNWVLLERIGVNGVAAQTIIGYVLFLQSMILTGIAIGIHPLISYHFGAKNQATIFSLLAVAVKAVFLVGIVVFLASFVYAEEIMSLFSKGNAELAAIGKTGLRCFSMAFIVNGYNIIAAAFFTSIGKAKAAVLVSSLRSLILLVVFLLVLPYMIGDIGIWLAAPLAETVTFIAAYCLISRAKNNLYAEI
jgi:putative MATE family efflux protein